MTRVFPSLSGIPESFLIFPTSVGRTGLRIGRASRRVSMVEENFGPPTALRELTSPPVSELRSRRHVQRACPFGPDFVVRCHFFHQTRRAATSLEWSELVLYPSLAQNLRTCPPIPSAGSPSQRLSEVMGSRLILRGRVRDLVLVTAVRTSRIIPRSLVRSFRARAGPRTGLTLRRKGRLRAKSGSSERTL